MQEHLFFHYPNSQFGLAMMNGATLPQYQFPADETDEPNSEWLTPWWMLPPEFKNAFRLKDGTRVVDMLKASGQADSVEDYDEFCGWVWYLNTRLNRAWFITPNERVYLTAPDKENLDAESRQTLREVFGVDAASITEINRIHHEGILERSFRQVKGLPMDLDVFFIKAIDIHHDYYSDGTVCEIIFYDGEDLPPSDRLEDHYAHISNIFDAIGNPEAGYQVDLREYNFNNWE